MMTELQSIQSNMDKWAKMAYGLIAVSCVVLLVGTPLAELEYILLLGLPLSLALVFFAAQKKSRVAAFVIIGLSVIDGIDNARMFLGNTPLFLNEEDMMSNLNGVYALLDGAFVVLAYMIFMEARKFHVAVKSRIVLKNTLIRLIVPIGYMVVLMIVIFIVSDIFFESSEDVAVGAAMTLWLLISILAMFRKLPGTGRFPTVDWEEAA